MKVNVREQGPIGHIQSLQATHIAYFKVHTIHLHQTIKHSRLYPFWSQG